MRSGVFPGGRPDGGRSVRGPKVTAGLWGRDGGLPGVALDLGRKGGTE